MVLVPNRTLIGQDRTYLSQTLPADENRKRLHNILGVYGPHQFPGGLPEIAVWIGNELSYIQPTPISNPLSLEKVTRRRGQGLHATFFLS